jgi:cytochrome c peroxidase
MHNGSATTLRRVVDFYVGGGSSNPYLDKDIRQLQLSGKERDDLVAFLEALTGDMPPNATPLAAVQ